MIRACMLGMLRQDQTPGEEKNLNPSRFLLGFATPTRALQKIAPGRQ